MKNNRALFIVLSFCTINVFGMETKKQKRRQNKYSNKHTYKAVVQLPATSSVATSKESFKVVVKSSGNSLVTVSKYTHKVVTSSNIPSVVVPKESFKAAPQSFVLVPRSLSVTAEKTTFGTPQTTKMLLAHNNALFKSNGDSLPVHEETLRHSVNEKIMVNHYFQLSAMLNHHKEYNNCFLQL